MTTGGVYPSHRLEILKIELCSLVFYFRWDIVQLLNCQFLTISELYLSAISMTSDLKKKKEIHWEISHSQNLEISSAYTNRKHFYSFQ